MMARRISGSDGCGGGPLGATFFPPTRSLQAPVLQIGKGDASHQCVPMQPGPGPTFEVAKPVNPLRGSTLLELLMHLLARPARLDGGDQPAQRGPLRGVVQNLPFSGYMGARKPPACEGRIPARKLSCGGGGQPPRFRLAGAEVARGPAA
jgi:hypothetical protein